MRFTAWKNKQFKTKTHIVPVVGSNHKARRTKAEAIKCSARANEGLFPSVTGLRAYPLPLVAIRRLNINSESEILPKPAYLRRLTGKTVKYKYLSTKDFRKTYPIFADGVGKS